MANLFFNNIKNASDSDYDVKQLATLLYLQISVIIHYYCISKLAVFFFWGGAISLGRMVLPSPKMLINLYRTYEKLPRKGEPYPLNGQRDPAYSNNEINSKNKSLNLYMFFICRWRQHIVKFTTSPFAPQIFFHIYFACWLYLIPERGLSVQTDRQLEFLVLLFKDKIM